MKRRAVGKTLGMNMPDRAIIPLFAAVAGAFLTGVFVAFTQTYSPLAVVIGLIVGTVVASTGFVSVIKAPGEESERWIVGALRGAVAAACFGFLYTGLLVAVRDAKPLGILWLALAAVFA
ncbi:MAG TPA: hypothetical protein VGJ70_01600, partial [Solirubrobacteraceae bacterium]